LERGRAGHDATVQAIQTAARAEAAELHRTIRALRVRLETQHATD
jgi:hypothetical protein